MQVRAKLFPPQLQLHAENPDARQTRVTVESWISRQILPGKLTLTSQQRLSLIEIIGCRLRKIDPHLINENRFKKRFCLINLACNLVSKVICLFKRWRCADDVSLWLPRYRAVKDLHNQEETESLSLLQQQTPLLQRSQSILFTVAAHSENPIVRVATGYSDAIALIREEFSRTDLPIGLINFVIERILPSNIERVQCNRMNGTFTVHLDRERSGILRSVGPSGIGWSSGAELRIKRTLTGRISPQGIFFDRECLVTRKMFFLVEGYCTLTGLKAHPSDASRVLMDGIGHFGPFDRSRDDVERPLNVLYDTFGDIAWNL